MLNFFSNLSYGQLNFKLTKNSLNETEKVDFGRNKSRLFIYTIESEQHFASWDFLRSLE